MSKLSDEETEALMQLTASGQIVSVIKYVNRLLYLKSIGDDRCARPLAFRDKEHLDPPCFALGYLHKISSFLNESSIRDSKKAVVETQEYITELKKEITKFFKLHKETL